ncbi:Coiled-coil domain-containing protein 105 [Geodia barretti]|uniref:Coiled-coil domain-containing protein 105 n=2 Tax=Geodia barretti TaxID=519541 RepID=A0AA35SAP3_GEOBA|nr:Coiled-coil domain-containing protein 105 [Geodia barretti]
MSAAATLGLKMQVSPDTWKGASAHNMKLSQAIIARCDQGMRISRRTDPLPLLRDACIRESNDRIHAYVRATRAVVVQLRQKLVATNEEIKALTRGKEALERSLEHTRKDLALSRQSVELRGLRPSREKEPDAADLCLLEEQAHLLSSKRSLEVQLSKAQQQLQVLSLTRARLAAVLQERSRVTDLLCHSMSSTVAVSHFSSSSSQIFDRQRKVGFLPQSLVPGNERLQRSKSAQGSYGVQRSKSHSAPAPLHLSVIREETEGHRGSLGPKEFEEKQTYLDPYETFSPESRDSVQLASEAILKSQEIRRELRAAVDNKKLLQVSAHNTVNEGLTRKLAETITITQHLQVNAGQTSLAVHRARRCLETQEKGHGYLLGPESIANLTTRERLDRPLVKVYQRHPSTELPEAAHFAQASAAYTESLQATRKNVMLLRLAQKGLQADIRDKKTAAEVDSGIVRLRRQKASHRWVLDGQSSSVKRAVKLYSRRTSSAPAAPSANGAVSVRESIQKERWWKASNHSRSTD